MERGEVEVGGFMRDKKLISDALEIKANEGGTVFFQLPMQEKGEGRRKMEKGKVKSEGECLDECLRY